jgi:type VII secretion integral membrane protein EccD
VAVFVASIRPPDLPDPGDEVSPATLNDIFDANSGDPDPEHTNPASTIEARARLAVATLIGLIVAVSVVIPAGAVIAAEARPGAVREVILASAVAAIMVLRARSFPDRVQATALLAASVATVTGVGMVLVLAYDTASARTAVALVVAAIVVSGCLGAVLLPGVRLSPVTRRVIDLIEYGLIILVPIIAFMIMGIYTAMRRI